MRSSRICMHKLIILVWSGGIIEHEGEERCGINFSLKPGKKRR
jgi:hypothetical protein